MTLGQVGADDNFIGFLFPDVVPVTFYFICFSIVGEWL